MISIAEYITSSARAGQKNLVQDPEGSTSSCMHRHSVSQTPRNPATVPTPFVFSEHSDCPAGLVDHTYRHTKSSARDKVTNVEGRRALRLTEIFCRNIHWSTYLVIHTRQSGPEIKAHVHLKYISPRVSRAVMIKSDLVGSGTPKN
jgi:hypothetical protein